MIQPIFTITTCLDQRNGYFNRRGSKRMQEYRVAKSEKNLVSPLKALLPRQL
jgi:hypothetical protein